MKIFSIIRAPSLVLLLVFFGSMLVIYPQDSSIKRCSIPKGIGGKYKRSFATRLATGKTSIDVVIKPKHFTREYLLEFAKRIRAEYCNEKILHVSIFDNERAITGAGYVWIITAGAVEKRRGTYLLDRNTGEEAIEYGSEPGKPIDEIRIDLSKTR